MDYSDWELFVLNSSATSHNSEIYLFSYVEESNGGHNICIFLVHSLPCGTVDHYVKSRNGLNFQMMKAVIQTRIQVVLQTCATVITVLFFQKKDSLKFKTRSNFLLCFIFKIQEV